MFGLKFNKKNVVNIWTMSLLIFTWIPTAHANESANKWVGEVKDWSGYHTPNHDKNHYLVFVRQADGKSFDIVDSPELLKLHTSKEKNLLVELDGEKTSSFLFWGGNLVVKNFNVIEELDEIPHKEAPEYYSRSRVNRN